MKVILKEISNRVESNLQGMGGTNNDSFALQFLHYFSFKLCMNLEKYNFITESNRYVILSLKYSSILANAHQYLSIINS